MMLCLILIGFQKQNGNSKYTAEHMEIPKQEVT